MSIHYSFYISTKLAPESLMRTYLLSLGLPWDPNEGCGMSADWYDGGVGPVRGRSREINQERFGFDPNVYFVFNTWGEGAADARDQIVRGTLAICRVTTGDAVLLFNGEKIVFSRRADTIYVNTLFWNGDYSLFSPPYELKAFKVDDPPF